MYKDYSTEDYLIVADESSARIRNMLETRFHELEELREAINDHYSSDDLFLKWAEASRRELAHERLACNGFMRRQPR